MTERYKNGKIYKLVSNATDDVYYGSTCMPLSKRLWYHKSAYTRYEKVKRAYITCRGSSSNSGGFLCLPSLQACKLFARSWLCKSNTNHSKKHREPRVNAVGNLDVQEIAIHLVHARIQDDKINPRRVARR